MSRLPQRGAFHTTPVVTMRQPRHAGNDGYGAGWLCSTDRRATRSRRLPSKTLHSFRRAPSMPAHFERKPERGSACRAPTPSLAWAVLSDAEHLPEVRGHSCRHSRMNSLRHMQSTRSTATVPVWLERGYTSRRMESPDSVVRNEDWAE